MNQYIVFVVERSTYRFRVVANSADEAEELFEDDPDAAVMVSSNSEGFHIVDVYEADETRSG